MPEQPIRAANIGPRERRKRLMMGAVMLAAGVGSTAALILAGVGPCWRIGLFVPFWIGALGVFQARAHT